MPRKYKTDIRRLTYSPDELAIMFHVKRSYIFDLIRTGKLKAFYMGKKLRISINEINDLLKEYNNESFS